MVEDFKTANNSLATRKEKQPRVWRPPLEGFFLINVDGAIPAEDGHFGIVIVIWDWKSQIVAAVSMPLSGKFAVEETEALAMEKGAILAMELGLENVILEGDSMQTVQAVKEKGCKGLAGNIISGIILEMSKFRMAEVRHISRNGNKIPHELAQQAKRGGELKSWTGTTPDIVADFLVYIGSTNGFCFVGWSVCGLSCFFFFAVLFYQF